MKEQVSDSSKVISRSFFHTPYIPALSHEADGIISFTSAFLYGSLPQS